MNIRILFFVLLLPFASNAQEACESQIKWETPELYNKTNNSEQIGQLKNGISVQRVENDEGYFVKLVSEELELISQAKINLRSDHGTIQLERTIVVAGRMVMFGSLYLESDDRTILFISDLDLSTMKQSPSWRDFGGFEHGKKEYYWAYFNVTASADDNYLMLSLSIKKKLMDSRDEHMWVFDHRLEVRRSEIAQFNDRNVRVHQRFINGTGSVFLSCRVTGNSMEEAGASRYRIYLFAAGESMRRIDFNIRDKYVIDARLVAGVNDEELRFVGVYSERSIDWAAGLFVARLGRYSAEVMNTELHEFDDAFVRQNMFSSELKTAERRSKKGRLNEIQGLKLRDVFELPNGELVLSGNQIIRKDHTGGSITIVRDSFLFKLSSKDAVVWKLRVPKYVRFDDGYVYPAFVSKTYFTSVNSVFYMIYNEFDINLRTSGSEPYAKLNSSVKKGTTTLVKVSADGEVVLKCQLQDVESCSEYVIRNASVLGSKYLSFRSGLPNLRSTGKIQNKRGICKLP